MNEEVGVEDEAEIPPKIKLCNTLNGYSEIVRKIVSRRRKTL